MVAVLAVKVALEVEALLVTDPVVDQRVEATGGRVAHVAVTAIQLTRADVALRVAVPITHLTDAL
eukprot:COSAG03_NODE_388_length_8306_cov_11.912270_4_plen_65_part_00